MVAILLRACLEVRRERAARDVEQRCLWVKSLSSPRLSRIGEYGEFTQVFRVHVDAEVSPFDRAGEHAAVRQGRDDVDLKGARLPGTAPRGHRSLPSRPAVDHGEAQPLAMPLISLGRDTLEDAAHVGIEPGRRNLLLPDLPRVVGRELGAEQ